MKEPADTLGERPFALLNASAENDLGVDRRQQMTLTHLDEGGPAHTAPISRE